MKKIFYPQLFFLSCLLILLCILPTACGTKGEGAAQTAAWQGIAPGMEDLSSITERTEYYDVVLESEVLFDIDLKEMVPVNNNRGRPTTKDGTIWLPVGTRFVQGEPVQFWAEVGTDTDIYLCRRDGNRELLFEGLPKEYARFTDPYQWYLDREGNCYCYGQIYKSDENSTISRTEGNLLKLLPSGEIVYDTTMDPMVFIEGLCETDDGRIYLLLDDRNDDRMFGIWKIAEVDPDTGELMRDSVQELSWKYGIAMGRAGSYPAVTGYGTEEDRMIAKLNMADGTMSPTLYFTGISYGWHDDLKIQDFQVSEDGVTELLWTEPNEAGGLLERLKMEKVERTPLVIRGNFSHDSWFINKVVQFNQLNGTYHAVVEDCGAGNDQDDFARLTSIQIGAGKGPDIIQTGLMLNYIEGMREKGALEELNPYMEASGIREEDYFPLTFSVLRQGDRIYGVSPRWGITDSIISEEVLGRRETPDIETLVDALLAYEGHVIYCEGNDSGQVLRNFLMGSESLWGMMDWENGSCDFNTPLFVKLLEAAKRYGDDGRNNSDPITQTRYLLSIGDFATQAELEAEGKVVLGTLTDDGCYPYSWTSALSVNANSLHKEGAWEFISFLISEEAQLTDRDSFDYPVHRKAYNAFVQRFIDERTYLTRVNGVDMPAFYGTVITEERLTEFKDTIERASPLPIRTLPILDIILEEAQDYFSGSKSSDDVISVINKRVQLYLNERS